MYPKAKDRSEWNILIPNPHPFPFHAMKGARVGKSALK